MAIKTKFWGTRGSVPVALSAASITSKIRVGLKKWTASNYSIHDIDRFIENELEFHERGTFGGNSSCVEISDQGGNFLILDAGTGLRALSDDLIARPRPHDINAYHIVLSHLHWDHISGFPFFAPVYDSANRVHIYGGHDEIAHGIKRQHQAPSFPVPFEVIEPNIEFHTLDQSKSHEIAGFEINLVSQKHGGGGSFAYSIEKEGVKIIYATDGEHKLENEADFLKSSQFFSSADLVIFDGMYSLADMVTLRQDWGHSSAIVGVDLCHVAKAKRLCLFHHEPAHSDSTVAKMLSDTKRYEELSRTDNPLEVIASYDGFELVL